jgi:chromosome segregation ATPase
MSEILSLQTVILTGTFSFFMLLFAYKDYKSYKADNHQDYKSVIVSLGVLGTFVGIFIGLLGFDTTSIKDSVPILLEGLKTAFLTSIIGMFLSIYLSAIQKLSGQGELEDELQVLNAINGKLEKLSTLDNIDEKLKNLDTLSLINTKLDSMDTNIKTLSQDITSVKEEMRTNQSMLFEFLEKSLNTINQSLDEAIDKLAEGATEEIIKALENVIQDFNKNLTEQFGDNFKQLNESVKNMVVWQENYKISIQELEIALNKAIDGIETTDEKLNNMTENYQKIDTTHNKLNDIIKTNENQIKNIETHLKQMNEVGEKAKLMVDSIDTFSEKIKGSLSNQSETLTQLIKDSDKLKKEIEKQLPESLGELNKTLTSLTNKFRDDYNSFLQHMSKIMEMSSRV